MRKAGFANLFDEGTIWYVSIAVIFLILLVIYALSYVFTDLPKWW